ncbi:MAG: tetratricopeptide repeat protein [Desulfomonilaceae bacterium]|nr:tetratricopeptide repeat protein [Desulfomonilaceae bacterium]
MSPRRAVPGLVFVLLALMTQHSACWAERDASAGELLKQAQSTASPAERIKLLDKALSNESLRGEILSQIFFERGRAYKEMNDCYRAIEDLGSALAHSRSALAALLQKAECFILIDQPEQATADVEHYLSIKPGDAYAYVLKGMIYEKQGFLAKAEDEYGRALHYESGSPPALTARAHVRLKLGHPRSALEDADKLCTLLPRDPEVFMLRAKVFVKLKEHEAALKDYARVESLNPGDGRVVREKVLVYFETGRPDKALEALSTDSHNLRDDVRYLVLRARAYILLGNYGQAEQSLKRAVEIAPDHASAYLYFGVVAMRRGLMDEALEYFNRALALDRNLVEAYKERARTFIQLRDNVRAAADLTTAAELDPADAEIFSMRGITYMNRMLYDAAVKDFTRAIDNLPGNPGILFDRAVANHHRDHLESALSDLNHVVTARPDSARARSLRGVVQFQLGNAPQAREDLEEATKVNPQDAQVWNNLGFFRYKMGDQRGAMDAFNRALQIDSQYDTARYNLTLVLKREETMAPLGPRPGLTESEEIPIDQPFSDHAR